MRRVLPRKSVVLATLFLAFIATACGPSGPAARKTVGFQGGIMGTTYHITVVADLPGEAANALARDIEAALKHVDQKMSTYKPDSELSEFNRAPGQQYVSLSPELFSMFQLADEVHQETDGAFDITVGPLVNLWGFGPDAFDEPPSPAEVEAVMARVGPDALQLDALSKAVRKSRTDVYCDLSGIAKGYAVDLVAEVIAKAGHNDFMVEVGGEVRTAGHNAADVPWNIAIEKPVSEARVLQEVVGLADIALATSGDYRNYYQAGGKRISHTIDPTTGHPVDHGVASVSVLHPRCALADAYATALLVLGPEKGMAVAERLQLPVMMVLHGPDGSFTTRQTDNFTTHVVTR